MKRSEFKRKPPAAWVKPERTPQTYAPLAVPANYGRCDVLLAIVPKEAPVRSEPYRRLVAALPCIHCHIEGYSQAAHPPPTGKGIKESDIECFPLCTIHPGADGELVQGCHFAFDQMQMVPRADMRSVAGHWAAQTRQQIIESGQWPKGLPQWNKGADMNLIHDMVRAIEDFKQKHPEPPQTEIKIHPDDYRELRREAFPILTQGEDFGRRFMGLDLVCDPSAEKLPRH